jgi:hypothetical protein
MVPNRKQVDNSTRLLYQLESLQPRKMQEMQIQHHLIKWKYSASVISKVDNDLRLEIRGYNPEGNIPKLYIELPKEMINWKIERNIQFSGIEAILLEINAYNK